MPLRKNGKSYEAVLRGAGIENWVKNSGVLCDSNGFVFFVASLKREPGDIHAHTHRHIYSRERIPDSRHNARCAFVNILHHLLENLWPNERILQSRSETEVLVQFC